MRLRMLCAVLAWSAFAGSASAQQRPLLTQDPEPVGAGRVLIEGGLDLAHDQQYPVSGLKGNLLAVPTIGISVGLSSIAELEIDGAFYDRLNVTSRNPNAPLASLLTVTGDTTHDVADTIFATKLPNASNESGLGLDTTDFFATLLGAKTVQSIRVVGNIGVGILGDPTNGNRQNDDLIYGLSFARAMTQEAELVGELNGRVSTRKGDPFPGTESRGLLKLGGRYTRGTIRVDAAIYFGLTTVDPTIGFTTGFT